MVKYTHKYIIYLYSIYCVYIYRHTHVSYTYCITHLNPSASFASVGLGQECWSHALEDYEARVEAASPLNLYTSQFGDTDWLRQKPHRVASFASHVITQEVLCWTVALPGTKHQSFQLQGSFARGMEPSLAEVADFAANGATDDRCDDRSADMSKPLPR